MTVIPIYKFRLIFSARTPGILNWNTATHTWLLPDGKQAVLSARHVGTLTEATEFHIDAGGFESPEQARDIGEKLRAALRLANAGLGLGLNVPALEQEIPRARLAPDIKENIMKEHGTSIADCVFGLNVFKEGEEVELAVKGYGIVKPKYSDYVLDAISQLWGLEDNLDEPSRLACELMNYASRDTSPSSAFLVSFLALDLLIERRERSEEAQQVLESLYKVVDDSRLAAAEKKRLRSFLGQWRRTSLEAEFEHLVSLGANDQIVVQEESLRDFLRNCLRLRHRLAHPPKDGSTLAISEQELNQRRIGLRKVFMNLVWARNNLPPFSVHYPGDVIQTSELKISII